MRERESPPHEHMYNLNIRKEKLVRLSRCNDTIIDDLAIMGAKPGIRGRIGRTWYRLMLMGWAYWHSKLKSGDPDE